MGDSGSDHAIPAFRYGPADEDSPTSTLAQSHLDIRTGGKHSPSSGKGHTPVRQDGESDGGPTGSDLLEAIARSQRQKQQQQHRQEHRRQHRPQHRQPTTPVKAGDGPPSKSRTPATEGGTPQRRLPSEPDAEAAANGLGDGRGRSGISQNSNGSHSNNSKSSNGSGKNNSKNSNGNRNSGVSNYEAPNNGNSPAYAVTRVGGLPPRPRKSRYAGMDYSVSATPPRMPVDDSSGRDAPGNDQSSPPPRSRSPSPRRAQDSPKGHVRIHIHSDEGSPGRSPGRGRSGMSGSSYGDQSDQFNLSSYQQLTLEERRRLLQEVKMVLGEESLLSGVNNAGGPDDDDDDEDEEEEPDDSILEGSLLGMRSFDDGISQMDRTYYSQAPTHFTRDDTMDNRTLFSMETTYSADDGTMYTAPSVYDEKWGWSRRRRERDEDDNTILSDEEANYTGEDRFLDACFSCFCDIGGGAEEAAEGRMERAVERERGERWERAVERERGERWAERRKKDREEEQEEQEEGKEESSESTDWIEMSYKEQWSREEVQDQVENDVDADSNGDGGEEIAGGGLTVKERLERQRSGNARSTSLEKRKKEVMIGTAANNADSTLFLQTDGVIDTQEGTADATDLGPVDGDPAEETVASTVSNLDDESVGDETDEEVANPKLFSKDGPLTKKDRSRSPFIRAISSLSRSRSKSKSKTKSKSSKRDINDQDSQEQDLLGQEPQWQDQPNKDPSEQIPSVCSVSSWSASTGSAKTPKSGGSAKSDGGSPENFKSDISLKSAKSARSAKSAKSDKSVSSVIPRKKRVWKEYSDPNTGMKYYSDGTTTTWDRPGNATIVKISRTSRPTTPVASASNIDNDNTRHGLQTPVVSNKTVRGELGFPPSDGEEKKKKEQALVAADDKQPPASSPPQKKKLGLFSKFRMGSKSKSVAAASDDVAAKGKVANSGGRTTSMRWPSRGKGRGRVDPAVIDGKKDPENLTESSSEKEPGSPAQSLSRSGRWPSRGKRSSRAVRAANIEDKGSEGMRLPSIGTGGRASAVRGRPDDAKEAGGADPVSPTRTEATTDSERDAFVNVAGNKVKTPMASDLAKDDCSKCDVVSYNITTLDYRPETEATWNQDEPSPQMKEGGDQNEVTLDASPYDEAATKKKKKKKRKGWREYTDFTTGNKYYSDGVTTTWDRPADFVEKSSPARSSSGSPNAAATASESVRDAGVESNETKSKDKKKKKKKKGWREYTDKTTGKKYYSDGVTTTWDRPANFLV